MTPAINALKKHKITHTLHHYEHDPSTESYGLEAASTLAVAPERLFKTLVVALNTGHYAVAVVPVSGTLNLKGMATATNVKKAEMADKARVQSMTGYVLGGVSPLGQKKRLVTVIDHSAFTFSSVYISAGKRGLDLELSPLDLERLCQSKRADISAY